MILTLSLLLSKPATLTLDLGRPTASGKPDWVKVSEIRSDPTRIRLLYSKGSVKHVQILREPPGMSFIGVGPLSGPNAQAQFGVLRQGTHPALWCVLASVNPSSYQPVYVQPLVWMHGHWSFIEQRATLPSFTNMGAMFVKDNKIICWDCDFDDPKYTTRGAASRFVLDKYSLVGEHLLHYFHHFTKGRYAPWTEGWPVQTPVPARDDPMREFGFVWTWYGKSFKR